MTLSREFTPARGFTLVECIMSILVLGGLLLAGMRAVEVGARMRASASQDARSVALAEGLLTEVMSNYVGEPSTGLIGGLVTGLLGIDAGENSAQKQTFDDVDDYSNWSESPPQNADGTIISGYTGWSRTVLIENVTVADPTVTSVPRTGLVRITVTVKALNGKSVKISALRADAMQALYELPAGKAATDLTFVTKAVLP